ncbi:Chloroperoxidase [Mycena olivaceomarginata]|nr:Chloroperoxidase [Mycena olivaceomarginata]
MAGSLASTKADRARLTTGETHDYQPPGKGASRSVCPTLNAMANHGYIQWDGKNISMLEMHRGLKACYGLSSALAAILVVGGWVLFKCFGCIKLFDIGLHNGIEHDASVVHLDCPAGQKYAPIEIQQDLVNDFAVHVVKAASTAAGSKLAEAEVVVTEHDMLSPPLGSLHADLGRGELAAILGIWNKTVDGKQGVPLTWIRTCLATERLPDGWSPDHVETLRAKIWDEEAAASGS